MPVTADEARNRATSTETGELGLFEEIWWPKKLMVDQLITVFSMFSHGFPIVFPLFSHVFPLFSHVFPLFSHVFPLVSGCSPIFRPETVLGDLGERHQFQFQDADPNAGGQPTSGGLGQRVETLEGVRPSRGLAVLEKENERSDLDVPRVVQMVVQRVVPCHGISWHDGMAYSYSGVAGCHELRAFCAPMITGFYLCSAAVFSEIHEGLNKRQLRISHGCFAMSGHRIRTRPSQPSTTTKQKTNQDRSMHALQT
jgi:hypothetical protein